MDRNYGVISSYLTLNNIVILKSGLEITQNHSNWYHSKAWVGFLFAFHSNYGSILHHFRDKARYWSKIVIFSYFLAFDGPVRKFPSQYCHPVWYGKTRMVGYLTVKQKLRICSAVSTEYRRVTDGQTGGQT